MRKKRNLICAFVKARLTTQFEDNHTKNPLQCRERGNLSKASSQRLATSW
jgi:hypothetical protein